jgi:hypothetical protein
MNKNYTLFGVLIAASISFAWQKSNLSEQIEGYAAHKYPSGSPAGRTGAPGESNCTSCHSGTAISGSTENIFSVKENGNLVNSYQPGTQYTISLEMASNPSIKGFQATVFNASNQFVGTFSSPNSGVKIDPGSNGKKYANQTTAGTRGANFPVWTFNWTAPATDAGPLTFYIASNKSNSDGGSNGDQIHLSQFNLGSTSSVAEVKQSVEGFKAGFSAVNSMIFLQYNSQIEGRSSLNLLDLNGKSVLTSEFNDTHLGLNKLGFRVPDHIQPGMYVVHFFVNNNAVSQSVMIQ